MTERESENDDKLKAMETLKDRFSDPSFLPTPISTDERALDLYLERTADLPIPQYHRLIAFAAFLETKLSWQQICDVYERMLRDETSERSGVYATWISLAEHMISKREFPKDQRQEVARDLFSIFERAIEETPEHNGLALGLGTAFLKEAIHAGEAIQQVDRNKQTDLIAQAVTWLNRALELTKSKSDSENPLHIVDKYVVASVYFRLGQCYMTLRVYKLALEQLNASRELQEFLGKNETLELHEAITRCNTELSSRN